MEIRGIGPQPPFPQEPTPGSAADKVAAAASQMSDILQKVMGNLENGDTTAATEDLTSSSSQNSLNTLMSSESQLTAPFSSYLPLIDKAKQLWETIVATPLPIPTSTIPALVTQSALAAGSFLGINTLFENSFDGQPAFGDSAQQVVMSAWQLSSLSVAYAQGMNIGGGAFINQDELKDEIRNQVTVLSNFSNLYSPLENEKLENIGSEVNSLLTDIPPSLADANSISFNAQFIAAFMLTP